MKRLIALLMALCMAASLGACGSGQSSSAAQSSEPAQSADGASSSQSGSSQETQETAAAWQPEKPVQCIVPFAAGGGSDILTRLIIQYADMPTEMVAVNVDGGAGLVGGQQCAAAAPDGYTLLAHNPMNLISQGLTGTSDLWEQLTLLAFVVDDWTMVCTNTATGWKTAEDFINYAKEHPGEVKWGVTGTPIIIADSHRAMEGLGIECTIVPYDGGNETRTALAGNHIQIEVATSADIRNDVEAGEVIPLFAIAPNRCPFMEDVPTLSELGVPVDSGAPRAYFAPANLPEEIVDYYDQLFKSVCENPEFVEACEKVGMVVQYVGAEEGAQRMDNWYESLKPVFEKYGLSG